MNCVFIFCCCCLVAPSYELITIATRISGYMQLIGDWYECSLAFSIEGAFQLASLATESHWRPHVKENYVWSREII